ncbi:unnamed protein product [Soboliphyme baturini]|uniref:Uncharacterized protein n=1 Tax=Soboliphyme baturini TaxID=241478 RepID=A0A183IAF3_9BILA|nr:unnamed protein product [Soboliphyme baturini]
MAEVGVCSELGADTQRRSVPETRSSLQACRWLTKDCVECFGARCRSI